MLKYIFHYTDGSLEDMEFKDKQEADDTAFLVGDHLLSYDFVGEEDESAD